MREVSWTIGAEVVLICSGVEEGCSVVSEGEEEPLWSGWDMMGGVSGVWQEGMKVRGEGLPIGEERMRNEERRDGEKEKKRQE